MPSAKAPLTSSSVPLSYKQGWNRRWFAPNLEVMYAPDSQLNLVAVLGDAISLYGAGNVKIVSGGHCYEDFVYNGTTKAIINMNGLNQVGYDETYGYYVDAGCENWTAYKALLNRFNRTIPAGSCYAVGAGGHISGGGYGLLSRLHGLTVDWITGIDVVVKPGSSSYPELIHVSANSSSTDEQNLFWALRGGGGGSFGAIARFYFETLPEAPDHAVISTFATPWTDSSGSVSFTATDLEELLLWFQTSLANQDPSTWSEFGLLKLNHLAADEIAYVIQFVSTDGESRGDFQERAAERLKLFQRSLKEIVPLREARKPIIGHPGWLGQTLSVNNIGSEYSGSSQTLTYLEAVQTLNGQGPNQFGKYKSTYMRKAFPADQVAAIYEWLQVTPEGVSESDMSQSLLQVDTYGGQINTVSSTETPIPQRSSIMKLQYQTYWDNGYGPGKDNETQQTAHVTWMQDFYTDVYASYGGTPNPSNDPSGTVDGCYYNYPDVDLGTNSEGTIDDAMWLYFQDNYTTNPLNLVDVKSVWETNNYFNYEQSIPTSAARETLRKEKLF